MKNISLTALVAIVGLAFVGAPVTVQAQTTAATPAPAAAAAPADAPKVKEKKKGDYTSFPKGSKISAIDASSLTITTAKGDVKLTVDATTGFSVDKKKSAITDFAVGDEVTGSYKVNADGTNTAHNVRKKTAK